MRSLVVYESMFGNTHAIAEAISEGLAAQGTSRVLHIHDADVGDLRDLDLLVVGGPTHVHGLTSSSTRQGAVEQAVKSDGALVLEDTAVGPGLRDWLAELPAGSLWVAAFDTRVSGPALFTGHASHAIAAKLRKRGYRLAAEPESFLVDKHSVLLDGEAERATAWAGAIRPVSVDAG